MTTQANEGIASGWFVGAGAAKNISLGWVPRKVEVWNITDGTIVTTGFPDKMIGFTSGGVAVPVSGNTIVGITSGARAKIKDVIVLTGSFAGGDAAGFFVADAEDVTGTFQSENITLNTSASGNDDATVVAQVEHGIKIDTAAASVTGTSGILSYLGDATLGAGKGFTVGSALATNAKLFRWYAYR